MNCLFAGKGLYFENKCLPMEFVIVIYQILNKP